MRPSRSRSAGRRHAVRRRIARLLLSGLLPLAVIGTQTAVAQAPVTALPSRDPFAEQVAEAARRFGIPAAWIRAVMRVESRGDPRVVSPKGAMGLMQIMPATWDDLRVRHALGADPYEPRANILAGAAYLRELHDRYGAPGFLAAYNAGPGRYEASLVGRPLPAETLAYVAAIAPALDGRMDAGPLRVAAVDPLAWTRAPLFVARAERGPDADPVSAGTEEDAIPVAAGARDGSAIAPRPGSLFVARRGGGEVR